MSNAPAGADQDPRAPWNQPTRPSYMEEKDYDDWFEEEWEKELDRWYEEAEMETDRIKDENSLKTK